MPCHANKTSFQNGTTFNGTCRLCHEDFGATGFGRVICPTCSKCKECGAAIEHPATHRFCSSQCWRTHLNRTGGYRHVCVKCKQEFKSPGTRRLICKACHKCEYCGGQINNNSKDRFCSQRCVGKWCNETDPRFAVALKKARAKSHLPEVRKRAGLAMRGRKFPRRSGSNHPAWRGGVAVPRQADRGSARVLEWRKLVFARDDYRCHACGGRGGKLHAHHIKPWALYPELRYDVANGQTLCVSCHQTLTNRESSDIRTKLRIMGLTANTNTVEASK